MDVKRKRIVGVAAAAIVAVAGAGAAIAASGHHGSSSAGPAGQAGPNGFQGRQGPPGGTGYGFGGGNGNRGGPGFGRPGSGAARARGNDLQAAATYLGVTTTVLRSDLQGGKTLAQVAAATSGKSAAGLIDALVTAQQATIEKQVSAGTLTRSQADQLEANLKQRVAAEVDGTFGGGRGGFGGPPGGGQGGPNAGSNGKSAGTGTGAPPASIS
jgi:hypothetical protein